ncbi:MAG: hypothetical protein ACAH83_14975 [Alphaproteobacteria bacterium]
MTKKLYVRFSTAADEQKIFDYYAENEHKFVAKRDPEVWKERISSGAVTLIEDEQGKIVASSIHYPLIVKDEKGDDVHKWSEIGSVRVTLDGIGLFKPLMAAHIMRAYLLEPPEDRFAIEIVKGNEHSKHVYLKEGATLWNIPKDLSDKVNATMQPGQEMDVEWFQLGVEAIPHFAKMYVDAETNPVIKNKKTGEEYELDFSKCVLTTMFQEEVKKLSGLDFGDPQVPNPAHGLKSFRDKFNP